MAEINSGIAGTGVPSVIRAPFSKGRIMLAAIMLALAATVAGCGSAGATITRLTVGSPGSDPYTLVSGTDQQVMTTSHQAGRPAGGDSPGLYGGTRHAASCDPAKLLQFLQSNPGKAKAWAAVHGISTAGISTFLEKLTPVVLRVDTLVTNHGYRDGKATGFTALLQSGIGVLIDAYGTPVVKCNCGNPLTNPDKKIKPQKAKYNGQSWPGFSQHKVTVVQPRPKTQGPVQSFTLVDPGATMSFNRPLGTMGDLDGPPQALPPVETGTPSPEPSVSPTESPSPDVTDGTGGTGGTGDPGTGPTDGTDPSPGAVDPTAPQVDPTQSAAGDGGDGTGGQSDPPPQTNGDTFTPPDGSQDTGGSTSP